MTQWQRRSIGFVLSVGVLVLTAVAQPVRVEEMTRFHLRCSVDLTVTSEDSLRAFVVVPAPDAFWLQDVIIVEGQPVADQSSGEPAVQQPVVVRYYGQVARWHLAEVVVYPKVALLPSAERIKIRQLEFTLGFSSAYRRSRAYDKRWDAIAAAVLPQSVLNPQAARWWGLHTGPMLAELDGERWWKLTISQEGVYLLTVAQLQALGIAVDETTLATVKLYGIGGKPLPESVTAVQQEWVQEQPLIPKYDHNGQFQGFVFYAAAPSGVEYTNGSFRHYQNPYATQTSYLLSVGGKPRRAWALQDSNGAVERTEQTGIRGVFWEEDQLQLLHPGSGRNWVGMPFDQYTPATLTLALPGLVAESTLFYRLRVAHYAAASATVRVYEHHSELGSFTLSSVDPAVYQYSVGYFRTVEFQTQASVLGEDRSALRLEYASTDPTGSGYIDWVEVWYTAQLQFRDGWCDFFTLPDEQQPVAYMIAGVPDVPIWAFDVTDPLRPVPLATQRYGNKVRVVVDTAVPRRIVLSSTLMTPEIVPVELQGLRRQDHRSDVLVITHPQLLQSAIAYAAYRQQHDSLRCFVVTTEAIFLEFAAGMPDPTAIRNFIAFAFHQWAEPPQFVVFWGDGHYDYRQISTTQPNFIPPWESPDTQDGYLSAVYSTVTEDFFVRVAGNDRANDLAIGRITIQSDQEGEVVLEKIQQYENAAPEDLWRLRVTLVADDSPTGGNGGDGTLHTSQSERLAAEFIPPYMLVRKIYLPDYPAEKQPGRLRRPQVTADLLSSVNAGTAILNWIGHGNPRVWAHEEIFNKDEHIPQMHNKERLFFLTAATCDFARFDDPTRQSGGEELLVYPDGGAIAVFSSARAVYAFDNARLNERFYQELFTPTAEGYARLGTVLLRVKHEFNSTNDEKFYLLGDPLVRLVIPALTVRVERVNGIEIQDTSVIQLASLEQVTIEGRIERAQQLLSAFSGTVQALLFDADVQKEAIDVDGTKHRFLKPGGLLNIGAAEVHNGTFRVSLIVPKDVSFSAQPVKLLLYAVDTLKRRFAKGVLQQCVIRGSVAENVQDRQGPEIKIFLEGLWFQPCDTVSEQPLLIIHLFDSTGINASGIGVGHDIQAWIDESPIPLVLTSYYQPSLEDARRGVVTTLLPQLEAGKHTIRVRAWDIVGNVTEEKTCFFVVPNAAFTVEQLPPYPQPFSSQVTIPLRHFSREPVTVRLQIFDLQGRKVWEAVQYTAEHSVAFQWQPGKQVGAGIYGYSLQVDNGDQTQSIFGTIVYRP